MSARGEGTIAVLAKYESASSPGRFYEVRIGGDERLYCTCPGWIHHQDKDCKHLRQWKENGQ